MAEQIYRILHVDDDRSLRDEIASFLSRCTISACETKRAALILAKRKPFNLYLLDISLPDGSGFGLCQQLRKFDPNTPIVLISIHDSESYRKYARDMGAQAFWGKSEDLSRLNNVIEACLRESRMKSFEAKRTEFAAIHEELTRQREMARARQVEARENCARYRERMMKLTAYRAFVEAGGCPADFQQLWPAVYAEAPD
jgi:DNA-binding response OmpR family regulator